MIPSVSLTGPYYFIRVGSVPGKYPAFINKRIRFFIDEVPGGAGFCIYFDHAVTLMPPICLFKNKIPVIIPAPVDPGIIEEVVEFSRSFYQLPAGKIDCKHFVA